MDRIYGTYEVGEKCYKILVGKPAWKIPLERLNAVENATKIKPREAGFGLNSFELLSGPMVCSCKHDNESSGSEKGGIFLIQLNDY